mgnify:CR=1 FL=1
METSKPPVTDVKIRSYRPDDHRRCRALWAELVESQRVLYDDPSLGGADPGAGFEEYMTRIDLSGVWVAEHAEEGVVGLVGLLLEGQVGEVEPIVVTRQMRGKGIGRALLERVAEEARQRRLRQLTVSPASRNLEAIRSLHAAGYTVLSKITLTFDTAGPTRGWRDGVELHGLRFRY